MKLLQFPLVMLASSVSFAPITRNGCLPIFYTKEAAMLYAANADIDATPFRCDTAGELAAQIHVAMAGRRISSVRLVLDKAGEAVPVDEFLRALVEQASNHLRAANN